MNDTEFSHLLYSLTKGEQDALLETYFSEGAPARHPNVRKGQFLGDTGPETLERLRRRGFVVGTPAVVTATAEAFLAHLDTYRNRPFPWPVIKIPARHKSELVPLTTDVARGCDQFKRVVAVLRPLAALAPPDRGILRYIGVSPAGIAATNASLLVQVGLPGEEKYVLDPITNEQHAYNYLDYQSLLWDMEHVSFRVERYRDLPCGELLGMIEKLRNLCPEREPRKIGIGHRLYSPNLLYRCLKMFYNLGAYAVTVGGAMSVEINLRIVGESGGVPLEATLAPMAGDDAGPCHYRFRDLPLEAIHERGIMGLT